MTQTQAIQKAQPKPVDVMMAKIVKPREQEIKDLLPAHYSVANYLAEVRFALAASEKLMQCTPASIIKCVMDCAQLGLSPSGRLGSAYLVPYRNKGGMTCTLIPGYRGLIDLAVRSGEVVGMKAVVIHQKDRFDWVEGVSQQLDHRPYFPGPGEEANPGPVLGAYAIATMRGGHKEFAVMTIREIESIRARSKASDSGPWVTDFEEMAKKTVIRRLIKTLPLSPQKAAHLAQAVEIDEEQYRDAPTLSRVEESTPAALPDSGTIERIEETIEAQPEPVPAHNPVTGEVVEVPPGQPLAGTAEYGAWLLRQLRTAPDGAALKRLATLCAQAPAAMHGELELTYEARQAELGAAS